LQEPHENLLQLVFLNTSSLNPELLIEMSLGSPEIEDRVWEGKLGQILVGVLQEMAGQGFRKSAWVRTTQAVGYLRIPMKTNKGLEKGLKRAWNGLEKTKKPVATLIHVKDW
jgi:hypothetical protein